MAPNSILSLDKKNLMRDSIHYYPRLQFNIDAESLFSSFFSQQRNGWFSNLSLWVACHWIESIWGCFQFVRSMSLYLGLNGVTDKRFIFVTETASVDSCSAPHQFDLHSSKLIINHFLQNNQTTVRQTKSKACSYISM